MPITIYQEVIPILDHIQINAQGLYDTSPEIRAAQRERDNAMGAAYEAEVRALESTENIILRATNIGPCTIQLVALDPTDPVEIKTPRKIVVPRDSTFANRGSCAAFKLYCNRLTKLLHLFTLVPPNHFFDNSHIMVPIYRTIQHALQSIQYLKRETNTLGGIEFQLKKLARCCYASHRFYATPTTSHRINRLF